VPRIPLDTGVQMLVRTGLTPDDALDLITHETTRKGGGLNVWCNGNLLPWRYIAKYLDFRLDAEGRAKVYPDRTSWQQPIESYVFELDADQVEALIAKLAGPGPGHPQKHQWEEVIDPVIVEEFKLRGTTKKLAHHVMVKLQNMHIPLPDASQIRKRFKDLLPAEQKRAK
jgi:hypothetical protein